MIRLDWRMEPEDRENIIAYTVHYWTGGEYSYKISNLIHVTPFIFLCISLYMYAGIHVCDAVPSNIYSVGTIATYL